MFDQFMTPEPSRRERLARRFLLSGLGLQLLANFPLLRTGTHLPDAAKGLVLGVSLGLGIAAVTLHTQTRRERRANTAAPE